MKKARMSFDEKRKAVSKAAAEKGNCVTKPVSFSSDDVPVFLEQLKRFEKESRKKRILAR